MELLNTKTSHRLEWIIIIVRHSPSSLPAPLLLCRRRQADLDALPTQLIAFEISLVLYREGLPFLERSTDSDSHKKASH